MRVAPGGTFGRYTIESRLGSGGSGVVYLALDPTLGRKVALKLLSPALAVDPDFRARFAAEARSAAALDHPHILPVYGAGEQDGQLYLAMRYVPGFDLGTLIAREGTLPLARMVRLLTQIAAALDAAHASGLVHRDVKPTNVLIAAGEHSYLADFGLARPTTPYTSGLTRPGQLVGSVDYLAPELLAGTPASPRSDVYALACLAVECLTGTPPFRRDSELATLYAQANDSVPQLSTLHAGLPLGLDPVVQRALAKRPEQRYSSATEFATALATAGAEATTAPPGAVSTGHAVAPDQSRARDSTVHVEGFGRRRSLRLVLVSLASLALFVGGALAFMAMDVNSRPGVLATAAPSAVQSATPPPALSPSPSASAPAPTRALVTLTAAELILPPNESPLSEYALLSEAALGTPAISWQRIYKPSGQQPAFQTVTIMIQVLPEMIPLVEGKLKDNLCSTGQTLSALPVGDATQACLHISRAPVISATVDLYSVSRNVFVLVRVVPSDVIGASAALENATIIARAQLARIERLAP